VARERDTSHSKREAQVRILVPNESSVWLNGRAPNVTLSNLFPDPFFLFCGGVSKRYFAYGLKVVGSSPTLEPVMAFGRSRLLVAQFGRASVKELLLIIPRNPLLRLVCIRDTSLDKIGSTPIACPMDKLTKLSNKLFRLYSLRLICFDWVIQMKYVGLFFILVYHSSQGRNY